MSLIIVGYSITVLTFLGVVWKYDLHKTFFSLLIYFTKGKHIDEDIKATNRVIDSIDDEQIEVQRTQLNMAISQYEGLLERIKNYGYRWYPRIAKIENGLGICYYSLSSIEDDTEGKLNLSINYFTSSIQHSQNVFNKDICMRAYLNRANSRMGLSHIRSPKKHLLEAIDDFEKARNLLTNNTPPKSKANLSNNVGTAIIDYLRLEYSRKYLNKAIHFFNESLEYYTIEEDSIIHSKIHNNLGFIYTILAENSWNVDYVNDAITHFNIVFEIITIENNPTSFANYSINCGNAYRLRGKLNHSEDDYSTSIDLFELAMRIFTMQSNPKSYAIIQNNLVNCYRDLIFDFGRIEYKNQIVARFENVFSVYSIAQYPIKWAEFKVSLGLVYLQLSDIEEEEINLRESISCFQESLRILNHNNSGNNFGLASYYLAIGLYKMARYENPLENVNSSLTFYDQALTIFTPEESSHKHDEILLNKGKALIQLHRLESN